MGVFACVIWPFACTRESLVLALGRRSAELVPRCLSAHQPSALTCRLLALASPASHPNNTAFDPSCVPAVADARQGSPAQPRAYLRSAKLWDRAALRSVPGRELFSTSITQRAREDIHPAVRCPIHAHNAARNPPSISSASPPPARASRDHST